MNEEEIYELIDNLRKEFKRVHKGKTDEEIDEMILDMFFQAYTQGKMCKSDLETLAMAMGYELSDDFKNDPNAVENIDPNE